MKNIKLQLIEFCQRCQDIQNIKGTLVDIEKRIPGGKTISIITVNYHCEVCNTFVRSEEHEAAA
jgi:hypothetical protein